MKTAAKKKLTSILLVDDNGGRRNTRAGVLMTNGYDVRCASSVADAERLCRVDSPDLVLIGVGHELRTHTELQQIVRSHSRPRMGFLLNEGQNLCLVSFNGETLMAAEGPDDMLSRVAMLLELRHEPAREIA